MKLSGASLRLREKYFKSMIVLVVILEYKGHSASV